MAKDWNHSMLWALAILHPTPIFLNVLHDMEFCGECHTYACPEQKV
jgi:hypothetical protein